MGARGRKTSNNVSCFSLDEALGAWEGRSSSGSCGEVWMGPWLPPTACVRRILL